MINGDPLLGERWWFANRPVPGARAIVLNDDELLSRWKNGAVTIHEGQSDDLSRHVEYIVPPSEGTSGVFCCFDAELKSRTGAP